MSYGFVKIYGTKLITSSLWDEAPEARLVFLSMLAIADKDGYVDVPNERALARVLNLPEDYLERALKVLMAPDPGSRNKAHEGRRILREESRWFCVGYPLYRDYRSPKQEADRARIARQRAAAKPNAIPSRRGSIRAMNNTPAGRLQPFTEREVDQAHGVITEIGRAKGHEKEVE